MYKKSLVRIEKENQTDMNNLALNDIIATNNVVLSKNPDGRRLSQACKAMIFMITFVLVTVGIVVLTLTLAHSRNTFMAVMSRNAKVDSSTPLNNSRLLFVNEENLTTITNELKENEYSTPTTVSLTTTNLHTLTTENVHLSTSIMKIAQNENVSSDEPTKLYLSSSTVVNQESTTSTTSQSIVFDQETMITPTSSSSSHLYISTMTSEYEPTSVTERQKHAETSSHNLMTNIIDTNATISDDSVMTSSEVSSSTNSANNDFDIQSSTTIIDQKEQASQALLEESKNNSTSNETKENDIFS